MYQTIDMETYEYFKSMGLEIELVAETLLDVCLQFCKTVAPRKDKYYLLGADKNMEEIAFLLNEFNSDLEFELASYNGCYPNSFILYLL